MRHAHFEGFSRAFLGNACVRPSRLTCAVRSFACHSGVERSGASPGSSASSGSGCSLVTDRLHRKSKELVAHLACRPAVHRIFAKHHDLGRVRAANGTALLLAPLCSITRCGPLHSFSFFARQSPTLRLFWRKTQRREQSQQKVCQKRQSDQRAQKIQNVFHLTSFPLADEVRCHG